jgi:hypothetical protein
MFKKLGLTTLLLAGLLTFMTPSPVFAASHGGGHFSAGHSFSGGGHFSSGGFRGGGHFNSGGHAFIGRNHFEHRGWDHDRGHYRGYYPGRRGFSFGFYGAPYYYGPGYAYGYLPGYYAPGCGFYDEFGYWVPTACAVNPYYGY